MNDPQNPSSAPQDPKTISYLTMRRIVGILGIALPLLTTIGYMVFDRHELCLLTSISAYYYTALGAVFVGTLCMIALFLIAYKGYNAMEDITFNVAAALSLSIALFPLNIDCNTTSCLPCHYALTILPHPFCGIIHTIAAGALFFILGYISVFFFTKTKHQNPSPEKLVRNKIYMGLGGTIWGSLLLYLIYLLITQVGHVHAIESPYTLLVVETICLWAFGISWLVKGEAIAALND